MVPLVLNDSKHRNLFESAPGLYTYLIRRQILEYVYCKWAQYWGMTLFHSMGTSLHDSPVRQIRTRLHVPASHRCSGLTLA